MSINIQKITEPLALGEGPHWDDNQQALFFVGIRERTIHKYVLATGEHTKTELHGDAHFIIPVEGHKDQVVVAVGRKFLIVHWDGKNNSPAKVVRELFEVDQDNSMNVINDGKVDPKGRLYARTLYHTWKSLDDVKPGTGSLYCVESDKITKMDNNITISNGLAFDLDSKAMYYVDSLEYNVRRYDYDEETGAISNMKYVFDIKKNGINGMLDGATIDTDGNLWLAVIDGSCVLKVDPRTGNILQKVDMPVQQVTSVTFGGPNLDILFVTSASRAIREEQKPGGCVFMVTGLGVKGRPNRNFKL